MKELGREGKDKLFNFRPVFFIAVFLCLGIVFSYLCKFCGVSAWWSLLLLPFAGAALLFCRNRDRFFKTLLALCVLALTFGIGSSAFSVSLGNFSDCNRYREEAYVVGRVVEKRGYDSFTYVLFDDIYIDNKKEDGKLVAYLPNSFCENLRLSDEVLLRGSLSTDVEYFNRYGFRSYEIKEEVRYSVSGVESCVVTGHTFDLFLAVRERVEKVVYAGMDKTTASVTMAVLTGDKSGMETDLLNNMRAGGIAHIFAVSGLHVGALYAFLLLLLKKTPLKRLPKLPRFILLALLLFFYAGVCGFSASVLRAMTLCLVSYAFSLMGLQTDMLESIGLSAIIILLFAPTSLFDVGFQLSFAACLGIAFLTKGIGQVCDELCKKAILFFAGKKRQTVLAAWESEDTPPSVAERIRRNAVSFLSVTLAAQIATLPILLNVFGYLGGWSVLLNVLFVPIVSGAFSVLLVFVAAACVLPVGISHVILYLPSVAWSAALLLFEAVDFSKFSVTGIYVPAGALICYYLGWTFFSDKWNLSKRARKWLFCLLFLAFGIGTAVFNVYR